MGDNISILIVDDDENFSKMISRELELSDYAVSCVTTGEEAIEQVRKTYYDIVLLDFKLPGMDGIEAIKVIKEENPHVEILMLTGHGTIDSAIASLKLGAYDYLTKPCRFDELENVLQKAYEKIKLTHRNVMLEKELAKKNFSEEIVGKSTAFGETVNMSIKVASTDCTVLIQGESGVGKELVAKLIHKNSLRKDKQFVVVDSTSLQEALLESELFGHEKGAFSGAYNLKHGLLEVADSGTLFLDEIGEISLAIQAKLLRVIEIGTFRRVGGLKNIHVD
ncbi:MAG: sigma-54 dependent transcriptional regulator, partial [Desulfatiglandales bacterium]